MARARMLAILVLLIDLGCGGGVGSDEGSGSDASVEGSPADSVVEAPVETSTSPIRAEFEAVARALEEGASAYFGRRIRDRFLTELGVPGLLPARELLLQERLALEHVKLGEVDLAIEALDLARELADTDPRLTSALPRLLLTEGILHLRKGQIENGLDRGNPDGSTFPTPDGGVHAVAGPATHARDAWARYVTLEPDALEGHWFLNLAHMALGTYPDGVDPRLRLPSASLASGFEVGRFRDVAGSVGVDALTLAGGVIVEDFDRDGDLDIFTTTVDPRGSAILFRNRGDGTFEDQSEAAGVSDQLGGLNCVAGDVNGDGYMDVVILRGGSLFEAGRIRNSLLLNQGDGTFVDATHEAGLAEPAYPTQTACFLDIDLDGDLDLYVGNESRRDRFPTGDYPSQLFENLGDGTFVDVAAAAGVTNDRVSKGVAAGDYDDDGDIDIYCANLGGNRLYQNNGDGTFTDVAGEAGVSEPTGHASVTWFFDVDNDRDLDLFVAAHEARLEEVAASYFGLAHEGGSLYLYRNNGDGTFTDVAGDLGLDAPLLPLGGNFGDLDHDGWLDLALATGAPDFRTLTPNVTYRNHDGRGFQDVTTAMGTGNLQKGYGVAFGDLDNDGDQDLYQALGGMMGIDRAVNACYENPGHGHHHLVVELQGAVSNRIGYGARIAVTVRRPDGSLRTLHRAVGSVSSFGGSPVRQEIGLGDAVAVIAVEVRWPGSATGSRYEDVPLDAAVRIVEGEPGLEPLVLSPARFP
jgi:hypothetical protein